ncbi:hypothetical protein C8F04DRAFT_1237288 [Mycena alexandri]|uniref:Uncharacterized protein n=1 Tax=Mycena alexandri TaxID=1745969 RepID=A0AAD6SMD3_9AGAR|nr:hypothetical protein C8F04DRAFT_1237288 [Mycena alexandri]
MRLELQRLSEMFQITPRLVSYATIQRNLFSGLHAHTNLSSLTIRYGRITGELHTATTNLPSLWRLRLHFCGPPVGIAATDAIHHDGPPAALDQEGNAVEALERWALHRQNLTIVPLALLGGLKALTISSEHQPPRSLNVLGRRRHIETAMWTRFCAECAALGSVPGPRFDRERCGELSGAHRGVHIDGRDLQPYGASRPRTSPCAVTSQYRAHADPLGRRRPLRDRSPLYRVQAHYIKLSTDTRRRGRLDTPLIQARPEDAVWQAPTPSHFRDPWRPRKWDEDAWQRSVPPPPTVAATREWLAVWKKYTPCSSS